MMVSKAKKETEIVMLRREIKALQFQLDNISKTIDKIKYQVEDLELASNTVKHIIQADRRDIKEMWDTVDSLVEITGKKLI